MKHTLIFAAGETQTLPKGRYFKILSSSYDVTVYLYRADGTKYEQLDDLSQGKGAKDPNGWGYMEVISADAQTVTIEVISIEMVENTISGSVSVSSAPDVKQYNYTSDSNDFSGLSSTSALSGQYSYSGLKNPAGSGKNLIVYGLWSRNLSSGTFEIGYDPLSVAWVDQTVANGYKHNNSIGVGNGVATLQYYINAARIPQNQTQGFYSASTFSDGSNISSESSPYIVPPGYVLYAGGGNVNNAVAAIFRWREE